MNVNDVSVKDGWSDDEADDWSFNDDDLSAGSGEEEQPSNKNKSSTATNNTQAAVIPPPPPPPPRIPAQEKDNNDWSFDDDDIIIEDEDAEPVSISTPAASRENDMERQTIYQRLLEYTKYLRSPDLIRILNESFWNISNNHVGKGEENHEDILAYYMNRPNLRDYTLATELPRMKYKIHDDRFGSGIPLENVAEIQRLYQSSESEGEGTRLDIDILFRAANQSILADAISTLTSSGVIQTDLYINGLAKNVEFELYFFENDTSSSYMHVQCELLLNMPGICEFGSLVVDILFHPNITADKLQDHDNSQQAMFQMKVISVQPNCFNEVEMIETSDKFMAEYHHYDPMSSASSFGDTNDDSHNNNYNRQRRSMRDSLIDFDFINMDQIRMTKDIAQKTVEKKAEGMKSALEQVDAVINIQSKWKLFQNVLPALPSAKLLEDVDMETDNFNNNNNNHGGDTHNIPNNADNHPRGAEMMYHKSAELDREASTFQLYREEEDDDLKKQQPPVPATSSLVIPPPPPRPAANVKEVIKAPSISSSETSAFPKLYRKTEEVKQQQEQRPFIPPPPPPRPTQTASASIFPKLYRKDDDHKDDGNESEEGLTLYRRDIDGAHEKPQPQPPVMNQNQAENVTEGWSDDDDLNLDLDLGLDDENNKQNEESYITNVSDNKKSVMPPPPPPPSRPTQASSASIFPKLYRKDDDDDDNNKEEGLTLYRRDVQTDKSGSFGGVHQQPIPNINGNHKSTFGVQAPSLTSNSAIIPTRKRWIRTVPSMTISLQSL